MTERPAYRPASLSGRNLWAEEEEAVGSFIHGQPFSVTSTDIGGTFGTKTTSAAPELWDNVDNIPEYAALNDGDVVPVAFDGPSTCPWRFNSVVNDVGNGMLYDSASTMRHSNTTAMYRSNGTRSNAYLNNDGRPWTYTGRCYVSWWWRRANETATPLCGASGPGNVSNKFIRLSHNANLTNSTISWTQKQFILFDTGVNGCGGYCLNHSAGSPGGIDACPAAGAWSFMEVYVDSTASQLWYGVNNNIYGPLSFSPATTNFDVVWKIGYDPNEGGWELQSYMDCVYVDRSLARVMVGNAATHSACTAFEMQPCTNWTNTQIDFTANAGAISTTGYVYVYQEDGTLVNSTGFPVTIGNPAHGDSYVVSGTGFGTGVTPTIYDDFTGGTHGNTIGEATAVVGTWEAGVGDDQAKYSNVVSRGDGMSAFMDFELGNFNQSMCQNNHGPGYPTFYLDFWTYHTNRVGEESRNWKHWRLYGMSDQLQLSAGWWCSAMSTQTWLNHYDTTGPIDQNTFGGKNYPSDPEWTHWQVLFKEGATTSQDQCIVYQDHVKAFDETGATNPFRASTSRHFEEFRIGHYFARDPIAPCLASGGAYAYLDKIYIATSWARVEVGNASSYASCTIREVQRVTSWTSTRIDVVLNKGLLTGSNWLFVHDEDNNLVHSEQITFS